ncbi:hypothetical protein TRVL_08990 [Trypanosoma vivax]|nr:hypothetical protein TRVL_08990 [Trypanosoma vivax]
MQSANRRARSLRLPSRLCSHWRWFVFRHGVSSRSQFAPTACSPGLFFRCRDLCTTFGVFSSLCVRPRRVSRPAASERPVRFLGHELRPWRALCAYCAVLVLASHGCHSRPLLVLCVVAASSPCRPVGARATPAVVPLRSSPRNAPRHRAAVTARCLFDNWFLPGSVTASASTALRSLSCRCHGESCRAPALRGRMPVLLCESSLPVCVSEAVR